MSKRSDATTAQGSPSVLDPALPPSPRLVMRKCKVCEWHGETVERAGEEDDCPWCHGPTDVIRTAPPSDRDPHKNPDAAALGRLGGLKGGPARAATLTPKQRRAIAYKAAKARWSKATKS